MFGMYRFFLAGLVVLHHFGPYRVGPLAVQAFFVLSGFLMTLLMTETYRGRPKDFLKNRFLRLYPAYWFTMALIAILILARLPTPRGDIGIPPGWNILPDIFFINYWRDKPQLVTAAWAVTNEIVFYLLMAAGLSSTRSRTVIWLLSSTLISVLVWLFAPQKSDLHYFSPVAASLPFAVGATTYYLNKALFERFKPNLLLIGLPIMLLVAAAYAKGLRPPGETALFLVAASATVIGLFHLEISFAKAADVSLGNLSYPIYLNHYAAAMLIMIFYDLQHTIFDTLLVFSGSIMLAFMTWWIVDRPIDAVRKRIRSKPRDNFAP